MKFSSMGALALLSLVATSALGSDGLTLLDYNGTNNFELNGITADGTTVFGNILDGGRVPAYYNGTWNTFKVGFAKGSSITAASGDGKTFFGGNYTNLWRRRGTKTLELPVPAGNQSAQALFASYDGSAMLGVSRNNFSHDTFILWRDAVATDLSFPPGSSSVWTKVSGISDDGTTVVGTYNDGNPDNGYYDKPLIWKNGVTTEPKVAGYKLWWLTGISPDGNTIYAMASTAADPLGPEFGVAIRDGQVTTKYLPELERLLQFATVDQVSADGSIATGDNMFGRVLYDGEGNPYNQNALFGALGLSEKIFMRYFSRDGKTLLGSAFDSAAGVDRPALLRLENRAWPNILNRMPSPFPYTGDTVTGSVSLARPAGPGGVVVHLSSASPDVILPSTVLVPRGKRIANYKIDLSGVTKYLTTTLTASSDVNTTTQHMTVWDLRPELRAPSSYQGAQDAFGVMQVNYLRFLGPVTFKLWSSDPSVISVAESVECTSANDTTFPMTIKKVTKKRTVRITATFHKYKLSQLIDVLP